MNTQADSIDRLKKLRGEINWTQVNDVELRIAYHLLRRHGDVFNDDLQNIVEEMAKRQASGGFTLSEEPIRIVSGNVPDWFYKWPFCMLWKQHQKIKRA